MSGYRIKSARAFVRLLRTRLPFRFGIAEIRVVPHAVLQVELEGSEGCATGFSADHLMPKWFSKNPASSFAEDVAELCEVVSSACGIAGEAPAEPTPFRLWWTIHHEQIRAGDARGWPRLLSAFGASLVERALLDAFCRLVGSPLHAALQRNLPAIELEALHPETRGMAPKDVLPARPVSRFHVRHTVGLSDPLTANDLEGGVWPDDGLPVSLEDIVRRQGVSRFKIKLSADTDSNLDRLRALARLLDLQPDLSFTLDGNESYRRAEELTSMWERIQADPVLARWVKCMQFIEQPLHRDAALETDLRESFEAFSDPPAVIIDESDGDFDSLPQALRLGYAGTTHKNCKGIFKSVANLTLLRRRFPGGGGILSGEDLSNVAPVALLQDLCAAGTLGLADLERNGHHYFRGPAGRSPRITEALLNRHADLFQALPDGTPSLRIDGGTIRAGSVFRGGLGPDFEPDLAGFDALEQLPSKILEELKS